MNDQRWIEMPVAELAAVILPWFGSGTPVQEYSAMEKIAGWLTTGSDSGAGGARSAAMVFNRPDLRAVAEAMQVLLRACSLMRNAGAADFTYVGLTRLGMHALQTNTVHEYLGLSDTPPTASRPITDLRGLIHPMIAQRRSRNAAPPGPACPDPPTAAENGGGKTNWFSVSA